MALRRQFTLWLLGACLAPAALAQQATPFATAASSQKALPSMTAAEIVAKNAAARGGVEAWQRLQTMAWTGYVESGATPGRKLPFLLEQKRPNKTRFELVNDGLRSIRMYDGEAGWKLRANPANGKPELSPYSDDELKFARGAQVIDGPLMDYVAKGGVVTLSGHGEAEGRYAYIVDLKLPSGGTHRIWVDAETFLEIRQDREVRGGTGPMGTVVVLFHDYRDFEGVKIATRIETGAGAGVAPNKLVIERVALNPELDDRMFAKPAVPVMRKKGIVIDARGAATPGAPPPASRP